MKSMSRHLLVVLVTALACVGAACGEQGGEDNTGANNQTLDAGNNGAPDVEEVVVPAEWSYEPQYFLRMTEFQLDSGSPGSGLNTLLRQNIERQQDRYPIVVLIELKDIDVEAGTLDLRGGAGLKVDEACDPRPEFDGYCKYQWDPQSPEQYREDVAFNPQTGGFDGELDELDFIATFEFDGEVNKTTIPVKEIKLRDAAARPVAYFGDEGESKVELRIEGATLEGYVTEEDADESSIQLGEDQTPIKLSNILRKGSMNKDRDGDGTNDAWQLTGTFTAHEAVVVP